METTTTIASTARALSKRAPGACGSPALPRVRRTASSVLSPAASPSVPFESLTLPAADHRARMADRHPMARARRRPPARSERVDQAVARRRLRAQAHPSEKKAHTVSTKAMSRANRLPHRAGCELLQNDAFRLMIDRVIWIRVLSRLWVVHSDSCRVSVVRLRVTSRLAP